jgi:hypothetical protein
MFRINGLDPALFENLFALPDAQLRARGIRRVRAEAEVGYPCRVSLADAAIGEELLLLPFRHHDVESPYRAEGPIYIRRGARRAALAQAALPACVTRRLMSLRAYDREAMMVRAEVVEGGEVGARLHEWFGEAGIDYVHLHNARPGCFSCAARRA